MSGLFFRGTNADQDTRFSNKNAKLLKNHKFPPELDTPVNFSIVQMDVIKPWIAKRVTELLGLEDEVVIDMIYNLLSEKDVDGKKVQIEITGFLEKNAGKFMKELWTLLLSAQKNPSGIPQIFLDAEEEKQAKKKAAEAFLNAEFQKSKNVEATRLKEMQEAADLAAKQKEARAAAARINANLKAGPPENGGPVTKVEDAKIRVAERKSSSRSRSRSLSRSPSDRNDRRASSPYGRGRRSRSPPPRRRRSPSRSFSPSPPPRRRSPPSRRRSPSGYSSRNDRNLGSHNSRPLPYDDRRDRDRDRDREFRGRGSDRYPDRRDDGRRDTYEERQRSRRDVDVSQEERSSHREVEERGRRSPEESRKVGRGEGGRNRDRMVAERSEDESEDLSADDAKADKRKSVKEEADSEEDEGYVKKKARGGDGQGRRDLSEDEEDDEDVNPRESGGVKINSGGGKRRVDKAQGAGEKEIEVKVEQEREVKRVRDDIRDMGKLKSGNETGRSSRKQYSDEEEDDGGKRGTATNYRIKGKEYDEDIRDKKSQSVKVETVGTQGKARDGNRQEKAVSSGEEREGVQEKSGVKKPGKRVDKVEAGKKADDESEERSEDSEDEQQIRKDRWQEAKSEKAMNKPGVREGKEEGMEDEEARQKRKEEKKKRKEERRVKRELKRKRQEEKKRRKEGKKMRDHDNESEEERSEDPGRQKEIEESLRKKVMESLKSKKQAT